MKHLLLGVSGGWALVSVLFFAAGDFSPAIYCALMAILVDQWGSNFWED